MGGLYNLSYSRISTPVLKAWYLYSWYVLNYLPFQTDTIDQQIDDAPINDNHDKTSGSVNDMTPSFGTLLFIGPANNKVEKYTPDERQEANTNNERY